MSQSWKMNASIETVLLKDKRSATSQLVQMKPNDVVAQELYDLYNYFQEIQKQNKNLQDSITTLRSAITNLLSLSGRKCQEGEFDKVCLNDYKIIQSIMNRVRVDIQQSEDKSNNQSNSQQNQIVDLQNKIYFLEDQIEQLTTKCNKLIVVNNQLFQQNYEQINNLKQLQQKQIEQNKKTSQILLENQLQSVNQNSINIEIDCQQFREKIIDINNQRQQLIELMQVTLEKFPQIQSDKKVQQNIKNQSFDGDDLQNIINLIRKSQNAIKSYDDGITRLIKQVNSVVQNKENKTIQDLLQQLSKNQECFIYIQNIFQRIIEMLNQMTQVQKTNELEGQLRKMQDENSDIKQQLQDQIKQLKEYNKKEQQLLPNQMINISNKFNNIFKEFNDQVKKEIYKFSNIIKILLPNVTDVSNISPDQDLLHDIQSFIKSIESQDINQDDDTQKQKWLRSINLFKEIYKRIPNNSIVNQYIIKSVDSIEKFFFQIEEYEQNVDSFKKEIKMSAQTN
ncbi:unnamed protein product [Paramecium primaurelia]|uniref:Uncharacterized protein n=1 Tax=Paramecium primaurelia TaxID=5886 RepID=A0A8S1M3T0_PARPR|nr:unnamed protein product [Paramecium primaurelia]